MTFSIPPPPPPTDASIDRGADTLATRCLGVQPGESVHIFTYHAESVLDAIVRAVERASGRVVQIPLEALARETDKSRVDARLLANLHGATATVLLAGAGMPTLLSLATVRASERLGTRHVHLLEVDPRVIAQSVRADPDVIALINERAVKMLRDASRMRVQSEYGTALEVTLAPQYPIVTQNGRPKAGESDNLPSGFVFVHPASVDGTFVADRVVSMSGERVPAGSARRTPLRVTVEAGRIVTAKCADPTVQSAVDRYRVSHANAPRASLITVPTNYLVRSEIGAEIQDMLLPGVMLSFGYSAAAQTRALFDAPVQMRLLGRKLTVDIGALRIVTAGRFENVLVEGVDPFR